MRNKLSISLFGLLFIFLVSCCKVDKSQNNNYIFNFMTYSKFQDLVIDYTNSTDSILNIKNINFSCGCMNGKIDKKILHPNETTQIHIRLQISNNDTLLKKHVTLLINSGIEIKLNIEVHIYHPIRILPSNGSLVFITNTLNRCTTKVLNLDNIYNDSIRIDSIKLTDSENFNLISNLPIIIKSKQSTTLLFRFNPTKFGIYTSKLKLYTSLNEINPIQLDLFGNYEMK